MATLGLILAQVSGRPDPQGLPGGEALEKLVNGLMFWALLAALAGLVIGAAVWALSSHAGNYHHAAGGRKATLVAAAAALLIGAAPAIINFFERVGNSVR